MFCNTAQALPECEGEDDTQWTNCFGTHLKKDLGDGVTRDYSGEFGNTPGKREGKGKSKVYKDGNPIVEYVGEFKNDRLHGQGTYLWADGREYVGEFNITFRGIRKPRCEKARHISKKYLH